LRIVAVKSASSWVSVLLVAKLLYSVRGGTCAVIHTASGIFPILNTPCTTPRPPEDRSLSSEFAPSTDGARSSFSSFRETDSSDAVLQASGQPRRAALFVGRLMPGRLSHESPHRTVTQRGLELQHVARGQRGGVKPGPLDDSGRVGSCS